MSYLDLLNSDIIGEICKYLSICEQACFLLAIENTSLNFNSICNSNSNIIKNILECCVGSGYSNTNRNFKKCTSCKRLLFSNEIIISHDINNHYITICKFCDDTYEKCQICITKKIDIWCKNNKYLENVNCRICGKFYCNYHMTYNITKNDNICFFCRNKK